MLYRSLFPRDVFTDLDRMQRDLYNLFDRGPSIRGVGRGGYPALNVGSTPTSVEVFAFAPGMDPATIDVQLERGVLTLSGERKPLQATTDEKFTWHIGERFGGRFRRVISLPDDVDPDAVKAQYQDGVLHVSLQRRASNQPRRIDIQ